MVINMEEMRMECFKAKASFVNHVDFAFASYAYEKEIQGYLETLGGCESVRYEVYQVNLPDGTYHITEFIIVTYIGGAIAPRNVTANSLSSILRDIASMMNGGCYDEVEHYKEFVKRAKENKNEVIRLV